MKKIVVFTAFLTLFLTAAQAQDVRFGFQLSPAFSWMTSNTNKINSSGTNLGLKLGMIGEYFFRENYSISTGIGFHFNAGGTLFYEETVDSVSIWAEANVPGDNLYSGGTSFKYSLQFVEIPLGLKMRTREFGYVRYYIEPHVVLGFRTQARGNVENDKSASAVDPEEKYNIQSAVNLLNFSWGIGGGMEYAISDNAALVGGIAFQSGFADVTKDKRTAIYANGGSGREEDSRGKVNSLVIRLGIMF
ncbi:MAG: outer membrane beta-barrel protein [Phaeodactylibacter sp.]|nr:outer membrane beta-barrel protein [Phaeodactylibacter sp.]